MNRKLTTCSVFLFASALLLVAGNTMAAGQGKEPGLTNASTEILLGDADWKLKAFPMGAGEQQHAYSAGLDESGFKSVDVPAEIQLTRGLEGMDLYRQSKEISLINKSEWWYRKSFATPRDLEGRRVRLVFEGADYFTSVWLNGQKLGDHEGAYTAFSFDITSLLRPGEDNLLAVRVTSPWLPKGRGLQEYNKSSFTLVWPGSGALLNKAPNALSFGWNGIPAEGNAVLTIGLTGDVKLVLAPPQSVSDLFVYTKSLNKDGSATLVVSGSVRNDQSAVVHRTVEFEMKPKNFSGETERLPKQELSLRNGENNFSFEVTIKNPELWWTWDMGKPRLYRLVATIPGSGDSGAHSLQTTFGIRTLARESDMSYWLNGKHLFLKGVWYPMENYYGSQDTRASYQTDLLLLKNANANYLLVQLIEKDSFYDLCDEQGLMVFTQMPFNQPGPFYTLEPDNPRREAFLKTAMEQGADMVKSRRNHPSIAAWGPLAESRWSDWAKRDYAPFYNGMKEVVEKLAPGAIYQASYCDDGEEHIWTATAGFFETGDYRLHYDFAPAFVSEYGSSAMSSYENLRKWISNDDLWSDKNPRRAEWFYLPINVNANSYLSSTTIQGLHSFLYWPNKMIDRDPRSAKELDEDSQLYQDFILRYASEAFRRKKYNPIQGTRWWAYKDPAPGYQWGFLDFDQVPKMAYYSFKRTMAPLAVSFAIKDELEPQPALEWQPGSQILHLPVWVVNDHRQDLALDVESEVLDLAGHTVYAQSAKTTVGADQSRTVDVLNWSVPAVAEVTVFALRARVHQHGGPLSAESTIYLKVVPPQAQPGLSEVPRLAKKCRVLLIGTKNYSTAIAADLRALGVDVDVINEESLERFSELRQSADLRRKYDVVWLASFEALWKVLDDDMAEGLAQAVQQGVGFIHTGSESSFHGGDAVAACLDFTRLAEVLPVKVRQGRDDLNLLNSSKDVRVFSRGWTDAGLKDIGIRNFNEVETKTGSEVVMKFGDWPLLVTGHYGKGHTVAFTGYTPKDNAAETTWAAVYAQLLLGALGENPQYRYSAVTGRDKPLMQLLKEQPEAEATVSPAAIEATAKDSTGSFNVQIANGDHFARLLRMRIEWSDPSGPQPLVLYDDNYFDLFPGEEKQVAVNFQVPALFSGNAKGVLIVEGTNVPETRVPISIETGR